MPSPITMNWPIPIRSGNWKFTAFVLVVVVAFVSASWFTLSRERQAVQEQAVVNAGNLARATEEHVVATIRSIDQLLLNVARDYRQNPDRFDLNYWVSHSDLLLQPEAAVLGISNTDGTVVLNNVGTAGHNIGDRDHFIVQRDRTDVGLFISQPVRAKASGRWSLQFSRRLERPDGRFAGTVVFGLDPNYFANFYNSLSLGEHGAIALVGLDGVIRSRLAAGDRTIGQSIANSELFKRISAEPVGNYTVAYSTDRIERIVSYRSVREYPLIVNIGLSTEEVLAPYIRFRDQVLLGNIFIGALALGIATFLIREIARRQDGEKLLETVLESAPATIQLKDRDLRIRWTNRAYLAFFRPAGGSPVGKRIGDFMGDAPFVKDANEADREVLRTGKTIFDIEQSYLATPFEPERHMLVTKTPIFGPAGDVAQILTIGTNITALRKAQTEAAVARQAERAAETARGEVSRLLSGMPTAVYRGTIDAHGRLTIDFISDNVATITGRTIDAVGGGTGWYDDLGDNARTQIDAFFQRVLEAGEAQTEYHLPGSSGVWIRDRARVVERYTDSTEIIGNWTDITREHGMAQQVMDNAKLATLGELATGLAHELNQPIAVMSLAAENAEDALSIGPAGIPGARVRLTRIVEQAQRAKNIVSHLRIFGRGDTGPLEPVHLEEAVTGALALVSGMLRSYGVTVETYLPSDLPRVTGRLVLIENVIVNLCVNARDAMRNISSDQRVLRIEGSTKPRAQVELRIVDRGGGIPASVMPRLFEPFFTTKSPGEGTGLGLSISHGMMQSIGGGLSVTNTGTGACFILTMQAAISSARDAGGVSAAGNPLTLIQSDS